MMHTLRLYLVIGLSVTITIAAITPARSGVPIPSAVKIQGRIQTTDC